MLLTLVSLLAASVVFVLISRRLGFGSILGYLLAGAVIGPFGLRLVRDVGQIAEISEFGVLMLLFLIGLELRLPRLWLMRKAVAGLGVGHFVLSGATLTGLAYLAGAGWPGAAVIGAGLALSSTAIVLPMLADRGLLASAAGRDAFAVLLFQDVASVPLIALVPVFGMQAATGAPHPALAFAEAIAAVAAIVLGGRFLVRPLFRLVGGVRTPEVFTATALLAVAGAAAVANAAGLPMSLGAFAAGVVLSESEYRHELQADIEPFEGLLLGFFFISVGMAANVPLMFAQPVLVLLGVLALLTVKTGAGLLLARIRGLGPVASVRFALALPQGSEFAFVLFSAAVAAGALARPQVDQAVLVVALSMFASPILFSLSERFLTPRLVQATSRPFDSMEEAKATPVVICGFGRMGQIVGRILSVQQIPFNAIDPDAENVDTVRRFGHIAYYGDPTRLDLLRAVGVAEAKVLVAALGEVEQNLKLVEAVRRHFPHVVVLARARNRRHAHLLMDAGVEHIVRETFFSSLRLSELTLGQVGFSAEEARRTVQRFREHDEQALIDQHAIYADEKQLIQTTTEAAAELKRLFEADRNR